MSKEIKTEFKINKTLRDKTGDHTVNEYIENLENFILNLKQTHTKRLLFKLDELNGAIADDLELLILNGIDGFGTEQAKILNDSKDSKVFERVMTLYSKMKDIQALTSAMDDIVPKEEQVKDEKGESTQSMSIEIEGNVFEVAQGKVTKRQNRK